MTYYSAISLLSMLALIIMLISIILNTSLNFKKKTYACLFIVNIMVCLSCEYFGVMISGKENLRALHVILKTTELSLAPFVGILPIFALKRWNFIFFDKLILALASINVILEIISAFTGFIFYVDAGSNYYHSNFYFIYLLMYGTGLLYFGLSIFFLCKNQQISLSIPIILVIVFVLTSVIIQLHDGDIKIDWMTISIAGILLFKFYGDMISQTDGLTNLLNRTNYENTVKNLSKEAVLIFCDVNKFKNVNDTYGHVYGDECLVNIAKCLKKVYNKHCKIYRYGGDEFCVVLNKDFENMEFLNKKFQNLIKERQKLDERFPGVAIGYAYFDPKKDHILDILNSADQQMYSNKKER